MMELKWWQKAVIYEIYVKSFCDSNNDGVGDLRGITQKLDYIKSLGISTIWLTPIYPSTGYDNGYDITSFVDIDPIFGSFKDFDDLISECHKRDMYLIMDFVPNHTSDQHEWFKKSCESDETDNEYREYYVWYPSEDRYNPPNNWRSVFDKPAWSYHDGRKAWYLHQFMSTQPDLNFRCPAVKKEIENAIQFWLEEKKVDGLRVDAIMHLYESKNFENEPLKEFVNPDIRFQDLKAAHLKHIYTINQPETYETVIEWRQLIDEIGRRENREKILLGEAYAGPYDEEFKQIMCFYEYQKRPLCNFVFNYQLIQSNEYEAEKNAVINKAAKPFKPYVLKDIMDYWVRNIEDLYWTNWSIGNHDFSRTATRVGKPNVDIANVLCLLLGGSATVYYGEEIGMENLPYLSFDECQDHSGKIHGPDIYKYYIRDYQRTPMQWNALSNCGFTKPGVKPWLPVNPTHKFINVEKQLKEKRSHLSIFKDLMKLRKEASFQYGSFKYGLITDKIFSFFRYAPKNPTFLVAMNLSDEDLFIDFRDFSFVPAKAKIKYFIGKPYESEAIFELYRPGNYVSTSSLHLKGRNCIILNFSN